MKSLLTIIVSLSLLSSGLAQTIRRVNNNVGISGTNVYSTFAAAQTAAASNDIILIEPSTSSYGNITVTKPLKIYGNGYFLSTNTELKADQRSSIIGDINFSTGSGGSELYGVTCGTVQIYAISNITLSRNHIAATMYLNTTNSASVATASISNIVITRNYISGTISLGPMTPGYTLTNVLVNNNILGYINVNTNEASNWVVRNNTFTSNNLLLVNSILENNLFIGGVTGPTLTNTTASYNVSTSSTFTGGVSNVNNYDIITNADLTGSGTGISLDEAYQIKSGSSLKTLGSSSSEVGAYGGTTPYIVSGIPAIPSITSFVNTGTGDATTPIKVTISVKSNN